MSSIRMILLCALAWTSHAAFAAKLSYHGGSSSFELTKDSDMMLYHSGRTVQTIQLSECNRKMVEQYWEDALTEYKKFPFASIKSMPPKKPYATLDAETRWIAEGANSLLVVSPESFLVLKVREAKACKR